MTLTTAHGPLGSEPAGWFSPPITTGSTYVEPHPRRVQATIDGRPVIDTDRVLLLHQPGRPPAYAFEAGEVGDLPSEAVPEAPAFVRIAWDAVDAWFEEGRQLVHYPPNPYHRVDCRPTRRRLHAAVGARTLVDTDDTLILFETALPPKLYVRPELVDRSLLRRSETQSYCNYKGTATYWHAVLDGVVTEDVAWSYEDPLPESTPITGFLSFDPHRLTLEVELPVAVERPLADAGVNPERVSPALPLIPARRRQST